LRSKDLDAKIEIQDLAADLKFQIRLDDRRRQNRIVTLAGWQSGHAAACKAVNAGSIPTPASSVEKH
jgi:hypothetical protein